ncbi:hypothetical protein HQ393_14675 [Chitinibacter bivalviorum]|uniref:Uncharacterized protein n=1 Tax=Chitinibacter bivalviorum TaxID=2739434 RepID=A0A7H9BLR6_9NEIS|nr:hypothetical protein [Chitinibacter bivalviorum]QLG89389.1 hypothetical protein HQ393_14675 [Chitinibacter bivalviorum]
MKFYAYLESTPLAEPALLSEVTLVANPHELRKIARFLELAAEQMTQDPAQFEHVHLSDVDRDFTATPSLIVFNPQAL